MDGREPFVSLVERGAGETELVLPSEIPWSTLKARDLEETVYWLLDALGAKDLEWRRGGRGAGAADQGRDLQATFQVQTLDGSFEAQRWWVEAKGRSRTVERGAVQRAVSDAEVHKDVDVLVIVTNGDFTNPLRDWVADWNGAHRRPALKLWDREALEKMLSRQPGVVLRLFSQALSPQGRLAAVRERFWNRTEFASSADLARLWRDRVKLKYCEVDLLVLIGSEYANGDPASRRWSEVFADEDLLKFTCLALRNVLVVAEHAASVGAPHESIVRAVGHSLVVCVRDFGAEATFAAIEDTLRYSDGK